MTYPLLDSIQNESDIKNIPQDKLPQLCTELREAILETVSKNGGHLASSLGAVEIIVAMHRVFSLPEDKIVFDVGHQAYAHKLLTNRREMFATLRTEGGISGFPKREESIYDAFNTGHASTSVSAGLGILRGQRLNGNNASVACLIGDGALTGGLAYEALDDAGASKLPLIVILNDNEMSISRNVGGLSKNLTHLRASKGYAALKRNVVHSLDFGVTGRFLSRHLENFKNRVKRFILSNSFFEELGFTYLGPIDGHNIHALIKILSEAKELNKPVLIHIVTKKGKGYKFAEEDPQKFHGVGPFNLATGELLEPHKTSCTDVFSEELCNLAKTDNKICAITAAMPNGTGMDKFQKAFPNRFFDVGIAEEHAVTMAAGLAAAGQKPVVAIYSSFIQRAADEVFHDVCLQNLPVILALDRAGLVGRDGETHNGLLDTAIFCHFPNLQIFTPSSYAELRSILAFCLTRNGPSVIRYNRGSLPAGEEETVDPYKWKRSGLLTKVCVLSYGALQSECIEAAAMFRENICIVSVSSLQPLDNELLSRLQEMKCAAVIAEEGPPVLAEQISLRYPGICVYPVFIKNTIVQQGTVAEQRARAGINASAISESIKTALENLK